MAFTSDLRTFSRFLHYAKKPIKITAFLFIAQIFLFILDILFHLWAIYLINYIAMFIVVINLFYIFMAIIKTRNWIAFLSLYFLMILTIWYISDFYRWNSEYYILRFIFAVPGYFSLSVILTVYYPISLKDDRGLNLIKTASISDQKTIKRTGILLMLFTVSLDLVLNLFLSSIPHNSDSLNYYNYYDYIYGWYGIYIYLLFLTYFAILLIKFSLVLKRILGYTKIIPNTSINERKQSVKEGEGKKSGITGVIGMYFAKLKELIRKGVKKESLKSNMRDIGGKYSSKHLDGKEWWNTPQWYDKT